MDENCAGFSCIVQDIPAVKSIWIQASLVSMESIHQRIKRLREKAELTQEQLAAESGVTYQSVQEWEKDDGTAPARKRQPMVARALGVTITELIEGAGDGGSLEGFRGNAQRQRVPVVGTAQLGPDGFWEAVDYPVGYGEGWVKYPTKDTNAYALRVKGDSMRPRIKPGEFVLIEPNTVYGPSNEVMVQTKDGRCMVKTLDFQRGGSVQLSSVNETDFKPITLDMEEIEKIHRVVAIMQSDMYYRDNT